MVRHRLPNIRSDPGLLQQVFPAQVEGHQLPMSTDKKSESVFIRVHPWFILTFLLFVLPQTASACAVCFGDPDSPWSKALNWGVLALLAVVLMVLGGIAAFFIFIIKRARMTELSTAKEPQP